MKKILFLWAWVFALVACTKEEVVDSYVKPKLYLDSCVVRGNIDATAYIRIDKGENFFNHKLQLVLYDVDNSDQQVAAFDVPLSGERTQELQKDFTLPAANKVYLASLTVKTDKNSFVSNSVPVISSGLSLKERFYYLHGTPSFYDFGDAKMYCADGVGDVGVAGERFLIDVDGYFEGDEYQLKVDGKVIKTENDRTNTGMSVWGEFPDLPAGKYDVSLVWKDVEIPLEKKLHILPWTMNPEAIDSKNDVMDYYSSEKGFCIGSKIYYCTINCPDGWNVSYDFKSKKWTRLRNCPYRIIDIVSLGNKAYAVTDNYDDYADKLESDYLVEYDPDNDTWKKLAVFPNNGNMQCMDLFVAAGNLYMCDGEVPYKSYTGSGERIAKTWMYDLNTGKWETKANIPSELGKNGEHRVEYFSGESMGYAMDCANGQLWTYDPAKDKWTYESLLKNQYHGYGNTYFNIMEYNGKLLYFGFGANSAVYSYDFKKREWELMTVYQCGVVVSGLPMTIYDNRIMVGPFIDRNLYNSTYYFLTVDIK